MDTLKKSCIAAGAMALSVALSACGTAKVDGASTKPEGTVATSASEAPPTSHPGLHLSPATDRVFKGNLNIPMVWKDAGLQLTPPSTSDVPLLDQSAAERACASGEAICWPGAATVVLARATLTSGGTANADGSITPLLSKRLVYATMWPATECVGSQAPPNFESPSTVAPTHSSTCYAVSMVDANDGSQLFAFSGSELPVLP